MKTIALFLFVFSPFLLLGQIVELVDVNTSGDSNPNRLYVTSNNKIFFRGDNGSGETDTHIWNGSGTTSFNTRIGANDNPNYFIELAGSVYYHSYYDDGINPVVGNELTRSDGSIYEALTAFPGTGAGTTTQDNFVTANGKLYFNINDGTNTVQIWMFDPAIAPSGSNPIKIENPQSPGFAVPNNLSAGILGSSEVVTMEGRWGDSTLYLLVLNTVTNTYSRIENSLAIAPIVRFTTSDRNYVFSTDGKYYFEGDATNGDDELWVTDGTTSGTTQISDINTGGNSDIKLITEHMDNIFFSADDGTGDQLYVYNGSTVSIAATINASGAAGITDIFSNGTTLYFTGSDGTNGVELWKYENSTASLIKNINIAGDSSPSNFVSLGGTVYFAANDGTGIKLWKTDGSSSGTVSIASLFTTSADPIDVDEIKIWDNRLVFSGTGSNGNELFVFDPATLSIEDSAIEIVKVYPNPTSDYIMVSKQLLNAPYAFHDATGKIVKEGNVTSEKIDLDLSSGLYLFKVKTELKTITKKIIIK